jgi:hypothetical protein
MAGTHEKNEDILGVGVCFGHDGYNAPVLHMIPRYSVHAEQKLSGVWRTGMAGRGMWELMFRPKMRYVLSMGTRALSLRLAGGAPSRLLSFLLRDYAPSGMCQPSGYEGGGGTKLLVSLRSGLKPPPAWVPIVALNRRKAGWDHGAFPGPGRSSASSVVRVVNADPAHCCNEPCSFIIVSPFSGAGKVVSSSANQFLSIFVRF